MTKKTYAEIVADREAEEKQDHEQRRKHPGSSPRNA
jgi:hypothetical protein